MKLLHDDILFLKDSKVHFSENKYRHDTSHSTGDSLLQF